jgi:hypothetical protein
MASAQGFALPAHAPAQTERTGWYCVLKRDSRKAWIAGPFVTQAVAENYLDEAHDAAIKVDPFHHFDDRLIASVTTSRRLPAGLLNGRVLIRGCDLMLS